MSATPLDVRAFLRSEGFTVGDRGRFSAEMIARVNEKHPGALDATGKIVKAKAAPKAPKPVKPAAAKVKPATVAKATATPVPRRPSPLDMPKRRPESTGFTTIKGILIRQDSCGQCSARVSYCACKNGPAAHKFLSKEVGSTVLLTLDKPAL